MNFNLPRLFREIALSTRAAISDSILSNLTSKRPFIRLLSGHPLVFLLNEIKACMGQESRKELHKCAGNECRSIAEGVNHEWLILARSDTAALFAPGNDSVAKTMDLI